MDHQDWTTVVLKKKKPVKSAADTVAVPKTIHTNKQNKNPTNAAKIEQKMEEGTFTLPKVTHNLQQQIQQARQAKNWTQKELAQKCNLTESVIKTYESGKAIPSQSDIDKMSKALGARLKNK